MMSIPNFQSPELKKKFNLKLCHGLQRESDWKERFSPDFQYRPVVIDINQYFAPFSASERACTYRNFHKQEWIFQKYFE